MRRCWRKKWVRNCSCEGERNDSQVSGDGDDGVGDLVSEVSLGSLLHLSEDHGRDFFRGEDLVVALDADLDSRLSRLLDELEWEVLGVLLDVRVPPFPANQTLGVKDGVLRVLGGLVLGGISDETLAFLSECDVRGCDTVSLVVGDDFDAALTLKTNARVAAMQEAGQIPLFQKRSCETPT